MSKKTETPSALDELKRLRTKVAQLESTRTDLEQEIERLAAKNRQKISYTDELAVADRIKARASLEICQEQIETIDAELGELLVAEASKSLRAGAEVARAALWAAADAHVEAIAKMIAPYAASDDQARTVAMCLQKIGGAKGMAMRFDGFPSRLRDGTGQFQSLADELITVLETAAHPGSDLSSFIGLQPLSI